MSRPSPAGTKSRVAVVTGGAGGLGRVVCARLARAGWTVCVVDVDGDAVNEVSNGLDHEGFEAFGVACDLTDNGSVRALQDQLAAEQRLPSALVTLAGVTKNASLLNVTEDDFELVHRTHVVSTLNCLQAFVPSMKALGYGRIVTTSSVAAHASPAGSSYGAAKGAVEGLTRTAALELARHGITVNCIAPGLVGAGMFMRTPEAYRESLLARIPVGRFAEPDEIAGAVQFLASTDCSYITGQTITACGGLTLSALA